MSKFEKSFEDIKKALEDVLGDSVSSSFKKDLFDGLYRYRYACGNAKELLELRNEFSFFIFSAFKVGLITVEQKNKCCSIVCDFGCNCIFIK